MLAASITSHTLMFIAMVNDLEFVDHRDVDAAEDVLEQLRGLGDFGAGRTDDRLDAVLVEGAGEIGRGLVEAAHEFGDGLRIVALAARIFALGAEGDEEVLATLQLLRARLEHRGEHVVTRRAGVG